MANENRLIDANALTKEVKRCFGPPRTLPTVFEVLSGIIEKSPTVDAVEVVHSWWEKSAEGYKICHHCKADVAIFSGHKNYCPSCGAKMDGDGNV